MELTNEVKSKIIEGIKADRPNYKSNAKHAIALGISTPVYSSLMKGKTDKQLSEASWYSVARRLGVNLRPEQEWHAVVTATYEYITNQLLICQEQSVAGIICDIPNIGKTFTAKLYAKTHPHVAYIDCSQCKTKRHFIKTIAREIGISTNGTYQDMYTALVEAIKVLDNPLVILDEAGDLQNEAFVELKALFNATEHACGWFLLGADGLKARIKRSIEFQKIGWSEILSRYGERSNRVTPDNEKERQIFILEQAMQVASVNAPEWVDYKQLARRAGGLRRVYTEIMKERRHGRPESN
mgnify:CR=1 FL=1